MRDWAGSGRSPRRMLPLLAYALAPCVAGLIRADVARAAGGVAGKPRAAPPADNGARLLFAAGFAGVSLGQPQGGWQTLFGGGWPPDIWGGGAALQVLTGLPDEGPALSEYIQNEIRSMPGRGGAETSALCQIVRRFGTDVTQVPLLLTPAREEGDLYTSAWIYLQPDLAAQLDNRRAPDGARTNWRAFWSFKSAGDYRLGVSIAKDAGGNPYWTAQGDNNANGGLPRAVFWRQENRRVPVPAGRWTHVETFTHRSADGEGRFWIAVDGQTLFDRRGPNIGVARAPINRVFLSTVYTNGTTPAWQCVDKVAIYQGMPSTATRDALARS